MDKYDGFLSDAVDYFDASDVTGRTTFRVLVAIANELAELNEFLGKRMPKPMSREDLEEFMRKQ